MHNKKTELLYMADMIKRELITSVIEVLPWKESQQAIIVGETIFYPQGGGQPYDQGTITSENAIFDVQEVRFQDGVVYHIGTFKEGIFKKGAQVTLTIDANIRDLHSKYHSAGHIIDVALHTLQPELTASKGFHFPAGAYMEYVGTLPEEDRVQLKDVLQKTVNQIIEEQRPIQVQMVSIEELKTTARSVPQDLPENKPIRTMTIDGFYAIPCGGTHVSSTASIHKLIIEKIKNKKGNTRISYSVE